MTDRELLEAAAKAAGIDAQWHSNDDADFYAEHEGMFLKGARSPDNNKYWNPLTSDADALRLAVKLRFVVDAGGVTPRNERIYVGGLEGYLADEPTGTDIYAATRRAIVRAAAEIAREKE